MVPSAVRDAIREWKAGEIVLCEFENRVIYGLTLATVDEVMDTIPAAQLLGVVMHGRRGPRRGEWYCGIREFEQPTYPPDEAIVAFDDWYRRTYRREARGEVNTQINKMVDELGALAQRRQITRATYDVAIGVADGIIPGDAPDREALLASVRWFEPWIAWTDRERPPPQYELPPRKKRST